MSGVSRCMHMNPPHGKNFIRTLIHRTEQGALDGLSGRNPRLRFAENMPLNGGIIFLA